MKYKDQLKKQKRKKFVKKLILISVAFFAFAVGAVYFLFFSGYFEIQNIEISKPDILEQLPIKEEVDRWLDQKQLYITRRSNVVFINQTGLSDYLLEKFPQIREVSVVKEFPPALILEATERKPEGIWCDNSGGCFYFDDLGIAYSPAALTSGFIISAIKDKREKNAELGEPVESENWINSIFIARDFLPSLGILAKEFIIPSDSFDEFYIVTNRGFKIFLNTSLDIKYQLDALGVAWKDKIDENKKSELEYIDLRIDKRIYYK